MRQQAKERRRKRERGSQAVVECCQPSGGGLGKQLHARPVGTDGYITHIAETGLTLKATGSVLLHRQWEGRTEHRKLGLSVRTSSAGWSAMISAMLRFSWGRSLGTAAAASGWPAGELTSFIFPGTGWRLLDGGLNLRLALGSTGIRITTAWIIRKGTEGSPAPLKCPVLRVDAVVSERACFFYPSCVYCRGHHLPSVSALRDSSISADSHHPPHHLP
ncbi:hypothetical protein INR49_027033 [Caranx melampygus]|nr:hypothetical protein INR49_027033 [Caranx melampygus]